MRARLLIAAIAGLSFAAAAAAEPAKAPVRKAEHSTDQPVEVAVAAADQVRTPAAVEQPTAAAPAKRERRARVSTCRCGDQTPND